MFRCVCGLLWYLAAAASRFLAFAAAGSTDRLLAASSSLLEAMEMFFRFPITCTWSSFFLKWHIITLNTHCHDFDRLWHSCKNNKTNLSVAGHLYTSIQELIKVLAELSWGHCQLAAGASGGMDHLASWLVQVCRRLVQLALRLLEGLGGWWDLNGGQRERGKELRGLRLKGKKRKKEIELAVLAVMSQAIKKGNE